MDPFVDNLRQELTRAPGALLDRWMDETQRRCWQLRRHPELKGELRDRCGGFVEALGQTLAACSKLEVGAPHFKEPMKLLSFVAGWMAGVELPVSIGLAMCHALQAVLGDRSHAFWQNLEIVVTEAYVAGEREKAGARHRQIIRKSQLVCMLGDRLAALVLVGDPDREGLQEAVGRLMMLSLMREATQLLLDVSAAIAPIDVASQALALLGGHREGLASRRLRVALSGLPANEAGAVAGAAPIPFCRFDDIEQGRKGLDLEQSER